MSDALGISSLFYMPNTHTRSHDSNTIFQGYVLQGKFWIPGKGMEILQNFQSKPEHGYECRPQLTVVIRRVINTQVNTPSMVLNVPYRTQPCNTSHVGQITIYVIYVDSNQPLRHVVQDLCSSPDPTRGTRPRSFIEYTTPAL